jgi:hypothetical protein
MARDVGLMVARLLFEANDVQAYCEANQNVHDGHQWLHNQTAQNE